MTNANQIEKTVIQGRNNFFTPSPKNRTINSPFTLRKVEDQFTTKRVKSKLLWINTSNIVRDTKTPARGHLSPINLNQKFERLNQTSTKKLPVRTPQDLRKLRKIKVSPVLQKPVLKLDMNSPVNINLDPNKLMVTGADKRSNLSPSGA